MMCAFYQFMKFIEKLGTGELSVQDNKVSHLFFLLSISSSSHFVLLPFLSSSSRHLTLILFLGHRGSLDQ